MNFNLVNSNETNCNNITIFIFAKKIMAFQNVYQLCDLFFDLEKSLSAKKSTLPRHWKE